MRVELETEYASPEIIAHVGDIVDLPENVARDLIQKRFAIPAGEGRQQSHRARPLGLTVQAAGAPDDEWTDPELLGELVERDEMLRRRRERERR
jgi:hypothetical protein